MIKKVSAILVPLLLLQSCLGDPDPLPDSIDTYHYYYNYLLESYDVQWEIDDEIIGSGHGYGTPAQAIVSLDEPEQEVLLRVRNSENGQMIDSISYTMYEYASFMIAILGNEETPHLICNQLDTRGPSSGMVKFRFLHASEIMGPVDIYIGGDQVEDLALAGVDFTQVSEYLEATEEQLWTAVVVSPASVLPADSTILDYRFNNVFETGRIYLCILQHTSNSNESDFQILADDQPIY